MWIFMCVLILIVVLILLALIPEKCAKCGKRGGIKVIEKKEVAQYLSSKRVEDVTRNKEGKIIKRTYRTIPITKVKYKITKKCNYCGHVYEIEEEKEL